MSYDWLPGILAEIADVVGLEAAIKIARLRGGGRATFPSRAPAGNHWLVEAIGAEAAARLCAYMTSGRTSLEVEIPLGPTGILAERRRAMQKLIDDGVSAEEIARRLRIASRTVRRHRMRSPRQGKEQGELF